VPRIEVWGKGRKDYSREVARITIPTVKGEQSHYWGVISEYMDPWSYHIFRLEKGFSPTHEWVPEGCRFILQKVEISSSYDSLLELDVYKEKKSEPGELYAVGKKFGYQEVSIESKRSHYWYENERPVYRVVNWNPGDGVMIYLNIYGIIERIR